MTITYQLQWAWLASAIAVLLFCVSVGCALPQGRPAGLIIDQRNRISLSRFQATAWTILFLSGLVSAIMVCLAQHIPDPIVVTFPPEMLAVIGISLTSLVAAPTILSLKKDQPTPPGQAPGNAIGTVAVNA